MSEVASQDQHHGVGAPDSDNDVSKIDPVYLRRTEFRRLGDNAYVDYTGAGQAPESLIRRYAELLIGTELGNPHSRSRPSSNATVLMEMARERLIDFVNGRETHSLVFTANASHALRMLAGSIPWTPHDSVLLGQDNHNSMHGMREDARHAGAHVRYWELADNDFRLSPDLPSLIAESRAQRPDGQCIVGYPAQSNFSGVRHPLRHIQEAHGAGARVILDTAAYLPTSPLDLRDTPADAAVMSFYKILGFPTGVGGLYVKKEWLPHLTKRGFAGGTVRMVSEDSHILLPGHARFEDGTPNFAGIPAINYALDFLNDIGGVAAVGRHVNELTDQALVALNGIKNVEIYGPRTMQARGGTIAFNILGSKDVPLDYNKVVDEASEEGIYMRGGCFCNPISGARALRLNDSDMERLTRSAQNEGEEHFSPPGAVRISFGLANTSDDISRTTTLIEKLARTA